MLEAEKAEIGHRLNSLGLYHHEHSAMQDILMELALLGVKRRNEKITIPDAGARNFNCGSR